MSQQEPNEHEQFGEENELNDDNEQYEDFVNEDEQEEQEFYDGIWPYELYQKISKTSIHDFIVFDDSTEYKREMIKQFEKWYSRLEFMQKMMIEYDGYFPFGHHPGKYGWDSEVSDSNQVLSELLFNMKEYKLKNLQIRHNQIWIPFERMQSTVFLQLKQLALEGIQVQSIECFSFLNAPLLEIIDLTGNKITNISSIRKWDFKLKEIHFSQCRTRQHQNIIHLCSSPEQKGQEIRLGIKEQFAATYVKNRLNKKILYELLMKFTKDPLIEDEIDEEVYDEYEDFQLFKKDRKKYKRLIGTQSKVVRKLFALNLEKQFV